MDDSLLVKKDLGYYSSIFLLLIFISTLVSYFFGPVFFHPNQFLLNDTGDSFKNYFTYEWHIQNDTSYINYTGSNYPFGENHLFTDGMPILSNLIKLLPFLKPYSIGIFNSTMLLSLFFCAILLFKIFKLFKIENWKSILSALGITVLCPQALRYSGHFALSYGFCIPLIVYLLLNFNLIVGNKIKQSIIISLVSTLLFFIHPYLGMICSSFIICYWIFRILFNLKYIKENLRHFIIQGILPLLLYFLIIKLTDEHLDRNAKPYGFFYLTASIETIFISTHKPFRHLLSQLYKIKSQNGEGIAYIGITSLIVFFYSLFLFIKYKSTIIQSIRENNIIKNYFLMILSSIVLLLFSMGFPFNLGMSWILDYLSVIQQFRAPGRFAWVFYFIICIGSCVIICKYFFSEFSNYLKTVFIFFLLILYTIEGIPYHNEVAKKKFPVNLFNEQLLDIEIRQVIFAIKKISPQAIIPLPFFHIGTDFYNIPGTGNITNLSFIVSLHSKIPLMANLTPRNSLTEAQKIIQIVGSDLINKEIGNDIRSNKPFIILYDKELLDENEQSLLKKGITILETKNYIVKQISPEQLFYNSASSKISFFESNKHKMIYKNNFYYTDSSYFYFNDFNKLQNNRYQGNVNDTNIIFEIPSNVLTQNELYEISFWYKVKDQLDLNNQLIIEEKNQNGNINIINQKNLYSMSTLNNESSFASLTFRPKNRHSKIIVTLNGKSDREKIFYLDNLMIRRKNVDVYKTDYSEKHGNYILSYNNIELLPIKNCK